MFLRREKVVRKLEQQVTLQGQSRSTSQNYIRRIALFVVHFGKLPEQIDPEEINEYLAALARDPRSPSRSSFKHMVYGLRYYYRLLGMNKNAIALPSLKKVTKLPVILNYQELKELFAVPTLLKQRIVLTLIYSAGLRGQEVINLKISDIDFERKTIGIVQNSRQPNKPFGLMSWCKAGYSLDGKWKNIGHHGQYLYPVHQLSEAFKGRFLDSLKRALRKQNELFLFNDRVQQAYQTKWVVHCEPSLASAEHVVRYLGQYTNRVAITSQRILDIAGGKVTFIARDYHNQHLQFALPAQTGRGMIQYQQKRQKSSVETPN